MQTFKKILLGAAVAAASVGTLKAETVAIHTPMGFEVITVSDNGKWAVGNYLDYYNNTYPFRWNLESGVIDMIGGAGALAYGVSDDGVVSGQFGDKNYRPSGQPVALPGIWKEGEWYSLEIPAGVTSGIVGNITRDGRHLVGSLEVNGLYTSFIWEDFKILRRFDTGYHNVAYGISPDGHEATGFDQVNNRYATYWPAEGDPIYFLDSNCGWHRGPWNYGRNFSPDGTKVVYWGGWNEDGDDALSLWCMYDKTTGEKTKVPVPSRNTALEFDDVANDGTMVGIIEDYRGCIWIDGKLQYFDDYLKSIGVDLSTFDDFYKGDEGYIGILPIIRVLSMSEDKNVFVLRYYNTLGQPTSMALKINQDLSHPKPIAVTAEQVVGLGTIALKWNTLVGVKNLRGYNVYRDGVKLNTVPLRVESYFDSGLADGDYEYKVSGVTNDGVETFADPVTGHVYIEQPTNPPYNAYARAKGYDRALFEWERPMSNRLHKRWYDEKSKDLEAFAIYQPVEVEMAIRFDKDEMMPYAGYVVKEVSFMPMAEQNEWSICFYTRDSQQNLELLSQQKIDPETLKIGQLNTVILDNPLEVPAGELLAAVRVKVNSANAATIASDGSKMKAGYSDLLRQTAEKDFFSCYESSAAQGYEIAFMSWAIDLGLESATYDPELNAVDHYAIAVDGSEVGTTDDTQFIVEGLETGEHVLSVSAIYKSGYVSSHADKTVMIDNVLPAVNYIDIRVGHDGDNAATALWEAPLDNDLMDLSYTNAAKPTITIKPTTQLMAGVKYSGDKLRGLDGYKIKTFRFYPSGNALFTFTLWKNDEVICEREVENVTLNAWNELTLPDDIYIDQNAEYLLGLDIFDPEPDTKILGMEGTIPYTYMSDLYSQDGGETWQSMTVETGTSSHWMMGMTVCDVVGEPFPVDGYDLLVDGKKVNDELIAQTKYIYDFGSLDNKRHKMSVNTYYTGVGSAVEGAENIFTLKKTGIDEINTEVADITIKQGTNILRAEGDNITSISVIGIDGSILATASGNSVDITDIAAGVCLVKVTTAAGKVSAQKVNIHR